MADREIGIRVGAAGNQAAAIVAAQVQGGWVETGNIGSEYERLTRGFIGVMNTIQGELEGGVVAVAPAPAAVAAQVADAFPGTTVVAAPAAVAVAPAPAVAVAPAAGYNTQYSGSKSPLKLAEHPELDGWLHAQCAALGILEVWDNRGKDKYIAAINSGAERTPPPFRSATDGIEKSLWPN